MQSVYTTAQADRVSNGPEKQETDEDALGFTLQRRHRLYLSRIEGTVYTAIQRFEEYIKKCKEELITVYRNNTNNTSINHIYQPLRSCRI